MQRLQSESSIYMIEGLSYQRNKVRPISPRCDLSSTKCSTQIKRCVKSALQLSNVQGVIFFFFTANALMSSGSSQPIKTTHTHGLLCYKFCFKVGIRLGAHPTCTPTHIRPQELDSDTIQVRKCAGRGIKRTIPHLKPCP